MNECWWQKLQSTAPRGWEDRELLRCELCTPSSGNRGKEIKKCAASGDRICPPLPPRELSALQVWSENFVLVATKHVSTIFDSLDNDGFAAEMTGRCLLLQYSVFGLYSPLIVRARAQILHSVILKSTYKKRVFQDSVPAKSKSTSISVQQNDQGKYISVCSVSPGNFADELKPVSRQLTQSTTPVTAENHCLKTWTLSRIVSEAREFTESETPRPRAREYSEIVSEAREFRVWQA